MFARVDTRKVIEAAATLLRLEHGKTMGRKRLLALLYLADRRSLERTGRPIIGGRLSALPYGPIHSEVYSFIQGAHRDQQQWSSYFGSDAYRVVLANDPGVSALSRYEVNVLNDVSNELMGFDDWDVAELTHGVAEYKKTYREGTSTPIPPQELIRAVGRGQCEEAIMKDAAEKDFYDKLFAGEK